MASVKSFLARHSPLVILSALCLVLALASPDFRRPENLSAVAMRTVVIAIIAMGQIVVIITAGIDLSVGSVAALAGVVGCIALTEYEASVPVALLAGVGVGALCGVVNGSLIAKGKIPPFIVTLGMMMIARGAALDLANDQPIYGLPESFKRLAGTQNNGAEWWIPVLLMLLVAGGVTAMLSLTRYGRALYATGGNLEGARLSGIRVDAVRIGAYTLCGACAGFAGMMQAARTSIGSPNAALMYELDSIAACVIGGASLMGGEGLAPGALAGALIMTVLVNYCNLMGDHIDVNWQQIFIGALVIGLVFYDSWRKRRAGLLQD